MLTDGGARTKALYRWEEEDLMLRAAGKRRLTEKQLRRLARFIWREEGWEHTPHPSIKMKKLKGLSYNLGRKIVLVPRDMNRVILIHELVHSRGYGDGRLVHPVTFVRVYLRLLSRYCGWSYTGLCREAARRGLLSKRGLK